MYISNFKWRSKFQNTPQGCHNVIGNGVVVHLPTLLKELEALKKFDADAMKRLWLSNRATLLFDIHQEIDGLLEEEKVRFLLENRSVWV